MHEFSLARNLLEIILEELARGGYTRLYRARVCYGPLSQVAPSALRLAFDSLAEENGLAWAVLELAEDPLVLVCSFCRAEFTPPEQSLFAICPGCGQEFLHQVKSGRELYLDRLEAE